jgi:hypothetical protein
VAEVAILEPDLDVETDAANADSHIMLSKARLRNVDIIMVKYDDTPRKGARSLCPRLWAWIVGTPAPVRLMKTLVEMMLAMTPI